MRVEIPDSSNEFSIGILNTETVAKYQVGDKTVNLENISDIIVKISEVSDSYDDSENSKYYSPNEQIKLEIFSTKVYTEDYDKYNNLSAGFNKVFLDWVTSSSSGNGMSIEGFKEALDNEFQIGDAENLDVLYLKCMDELFGGGLITIDENTTLTSTNESTDISNLLFKVSQGYEHMKNDREGHLATIYKNNGDGDVLAAGFLSSNDYTANNDSLDIGAKMLMSGFTAGVGEVLSAHKFGSVLVEKANNAQKKVMSYADKVEANARGNIMAGESATKLNQLFVDSMTEYSESIKKLLPQQPRHLSA